MTQDELPKPCDCQQPEAQAFSKLWSICCRSEIKEEKAKLICKNCGRIVEGCCEG